MPPALAAKPYPTPLSELAVQVFDRVSRQRMELGEMGGMTIKPITTRMVADELDAMKIGDEDTREEVFVWVQAMDDEFIAGIQRRRAAK